MDLLKQGDVRRNQEVIAVGYGKQYVGDERDFKTTLKFTTMHIIRIENHDLNRTIPFSEQYTKICHGRYP